MIPVGYLTEPNCKSEIFAKNYTSWIQNLLNDSVKLCCLTKLHKNVILDIFLQSCHVLSSRGDLAISCFTGFDTNSM